MQQINKERGDSERVNGTEMERGGERTKRDIKTKREGEEKTSRMGWRVEMGYTIL